jgi:hypothetical protein
MFDHELFEDGFGFDSDSNSENGKKKDKLD